MPQRHAYLEQACGGDGGAEGASRSPVGGSWPGGQFPRPDLINSADIPEPLPLRQSDVDPLLGIVRYVGDYELLGELGRAAWASSTRPGRPASNRLVALKMILAGGHAGRGRPGAASAPRPRPSPACSTPTSSRSTRSASTTAGRSSRWSSVAAAAWTGKLDGTPLPPREAAQLVETLARAMHAAHEANVIHRDLKPANILLTPTARPRSPTSAWPRSSTRPARPQTGAIMGTPSYMAPEQAGGKSKEIGPAADIYALGAILYELLTGRPPFLAATRAGHAAAGGQRRAGAAAAAADRRCRATWRRSA